MAPDEVRTLFDLPPLPPSPEPERTDRPRYNIAPTQPILGLVADAGGLSRRGRWFGWSFFPPSGRRGPLINARAETALDRRTFAGAARGRRCVIVADGFFEWSQRGKTKWPHHIRPRAGALCLFGALWNPWPTGDAGCAILTVAANDAVAPLHDRMPLVLRAEDLWRWLDPSVRDLDELERLLDPGGEGELEVVPVSRRVSSVANDDPACLERAEPPVPDEEPRVEPSPQLGFDW